MTEMETENQTAKDNTDKQPTAPGESIQ